MKNFVFAFLFLTLTTLCFGQKPDSVSFKFNEKFSDWGIIGGIHQWDNTFFELGFALDNGINSRCAFGSAYFGKSLSVEYNPFGKVGGVLLTAWTNAMTIFSFGINVNAYTN